MSAERTRTAAERILEEDAEYIGSALKVRLYNAVAASASGSTIIDPDNRRYLDFAGGWAVATTGYAHPRVVDAVSSAVESLSFASLSSLAHSAAVELAKRLLDVVPAAKPGPRKVNYGLSGSDANDGIAKLLPMARRRPKMISFLGGMHGMTGVSAGISGHPAMGRFPSPTNVTRVPYPYPYRPAFGTAESCGREAVRFIEEQILTTVSPPELTAGIMVESIQSDAGVIVPPPDFMPALRALCDKYDVFLVDDEVKVGMGRTGRMWACELTDTKPDVMIIGKGVASGQSMSAMVAPAEVLDVLAAGHAFTTAGSPVACAAAIATLDVVRDERLADNAHAQGEFIMNGIREMSSRHRLIGEVRGAGLIVGVELVLDPVTKAPATKECAKLVIRCQQLGLLVHYVGIFSQVIELTPPLVLTRAEAVAGLEIFDQALSDVENGRVSDSELEAVSGW
jgi:4-aminobutyrate aminotransferase